MGWDDNIRSVDVCFWGHRSGTFKDTTHTVAEEFEENNETILSVYIELAIGRGLNGLRSELLNTTLRNKY
jgi:hypothetical protein